MSFNDKQYPTLALASNPIELRQLPTDNLVTLCNELRQFLLTSVSRSSGHLASGLGVVELTVALHYIYDTPFDRLIWDIGHQAYPHKILTGRRDMLNTIRQRNGLHPFPWRGESEYDQLSVGHASTAISAGLGMAVAAKHEGLGRRIVCVIGDGSITGGMAFEAMNHAGDIKSDLLVVLNYNEMSISANVGALNKHLAQIISGKLFTLRKTCEKQARSGVQLIAEQEKISDANIPVIEASSKFFESLGFNYVGPLDGHNLQILLQTLKTVRKKTGPQLIHIITKKGRGYALAEQDPIRWHAVPKFNQKTGILKTIDSSGCTSYSTVFGNWLCHTAASDDKLMAITPAMCEGSGMVSFSQQYPRQYFDVAIAEQHAVTFAAGLAIGGYNPVVAIYSTFLQRAYDQIIHDVALQNLPIMIVIDRGGIVGADGQTHQGAFDLSYLRCIPNIVIMTPSDENECLLMLHTGYCYRAGPIAVRYPRGNANGLNVSAIFSDLYELPLGKGKVRRNGKSVAILNFGTLLPQADEAAEALNATIVDMRFVKPLDGDLIKELTTSHQALITVEENAIIGGAGSGVNEFVMYHKLQVPILNIGLPDHFIPHGGQTEILADLRLDALGIRQQIDNWLG